MSEAKPIRKADLARHWKVSASYVTKLGRTKGMPDFLSLAAADEWRALYAPAVATLEIARTSPTPPISTPAAASAPPVSQDVPPDAEAEGGEKKRHQPTPLEAIGQEQLDAFCAIDGTFEETMIRRARRNALIAGGMCERAFAAGLVTHVAAWGDRFNDQAETARKLTTGYLELQEKAAVLVPIDTVMDVIGTELQQLRGYLQKFAARYGPKANPDNPILAASVIEAGVEEIFRQIDHVESLSGDQLRAS